MLNRAWHKMDLPTFLTSLFLGFTALSAVSMVAKADCEFVCSTYSSPAFSPFAGQAMMYPMPNTGYVGINTGQFQPVDPRVQTLNILATQDYTPMGTTYAPSVGLQPIAANWAAIPIENSLYSSGGARY